MRSTHADTFNHDDVAPGYDREVQNESDPIRAGYGAVLDWVARVAGISRGDRVLELGSGTGNLTERIPPCKELVCVDVSQKMEGQLLEKLPPRYNRSFVKEDILGVFSRKIGEFDAILSTYTVHHLTEDEKQQLFQAIWKSLRDQGRAVFGDLMLESPVSKEQKVSEYLRKGELGTVEAIEGEFFWYVDQAKASLEKIGFQVEFRRFSDLSFGIVAKKVGLGDHLSARSENEGNEE